MDLAPPIGEPAPDLALLAAKASCPRTGPADQKGQQTLHKTGHGSKWGQGLALPISIPTIVNPTRATEPTEGTLVWWLEGSVLLGLRGCLLHRVTFPRLQNTTKLIMDTKTQRIRQNELTEECVPNKGLSQNLKKKKPKTKKQQINKQKNKTQWNGDK